MDVVEVPFNRFLGLRRAEEGTDHLLELEGLPSFTNHLGTVHACVQLALAEASSAECLLRTFPDLAASVIAVVRRLEAKFKNLVKGKIVSKARIHKEDASKLLEMLASKGRGLITVAVDVMDGAGLVGMTASVEWFIQRQAPADAG